MIELHITEEGIERTDYNKRGELRFKLTYPHMENIPSDVLTKLSVLRLLPEHSDIPEIGHKVSDNIYWIYEDGVGLESQFISAYAMYGIDIKTLPLAAIINKTTISSILERANEIIQTLYTGEKHERN